MPVISSRGQEREELGSITKKIWGGPGGRVGIDREGRESLVKAGAMVANQEA